MQQTETSSFFQLVNILVGGGVVLVAVISYWLFTTSRRHKKNISLVGAEIRGKLQSDLLFTTIQDAVMVITEDGAIQAFNTGAERITGWSAKDAIGLDYQLVIKLIDDKGEPIPPYSNPFIKVLNTKTSVRENSLHLVTKSDKRPLLSLAISPLLDGRGKVTAAVAIFSDISKEVKEQQQRAEFISTASHEMRTPVAAIEGYIALAMNENVSKIDSKAREYLEKAHTSTEHLGKLFQDLLTSARAEDGRLSNHPAPVELGVFLEQLVDGLRFSAEKKHLTTEFVIGSQPETIDATSGSITKVIKPLYWVLVDPERIREVVTNLFDNAVKYTEAGKITVGVTGNNDVVQVRISDTGPGIPQEDVGHLFEKFYRIDNSATRTVGGTGLGLFICRKIIELYNGRIWVDSSIGKGSTFYINLPRLAGDKAGKMQAQTDSFVPPVQANSEAAAQEAKPKNVLQLP